MTDIMYKGYLKWLKSQKCPVCGKKDIEVYKLDHGPEGIYYRCKSTQIRVYRKVEIREGWITT